MAPSLSYTSHFCPPKASPDGLLDRERSALRHCLQEFSDEHRKLLLAPSLSNGAVREMAERSGRTANSLYKLLGRLRENCLNACSTG